LQTILQLAAG